MELPLAYYGDPVLRKKCAPVEDITDEIRQFINDMIDTMNAKNGIGLAAPQVHRSISIFITKVPVLNDEGEATPGELIVYINPKIIDISQEQWACSEGCISIPTIYEDVSRPARVKVTALNLHGEPFEVEATGLEAHCIMHENDHINGVLFIDRIDRKKRKKIDPLLKKVKKNFYLSEKTKQ